MAQTAAGALNLPLQKLADLIALCPWFQRWVAGENRDPVLDKDLTAPPGGESEGDRYIVGAEATGAWSGHDHEVAEYSGAAWGFTEPSDNDAVWVEDEEVVYTWDEGGGSWGEWTSTDTADYIRLYNVTVADMPAVPNDADAWRYASIWFAQEDRFEALEVSEGGGPWDTRQSARILLAGILPAAYVGDLREELLWITNLGGRMIWWIRENAKVVGDLGVERVWKAGGPEVSGADEEENYVSLLLGVEWQGL